MKNTPAPWIARHIPADEPDVRFSLWVDSSTGAPLADVRTRPDNEHAANAQLIAAAPELLAALEDVLAAIKAARTTRAPAGHYDEDVYYNGVDFAPQLDIAAEIIAKAQA